jgi:FtsZ-binding cell division protein ZapB
LGSLGPNSSIIASPGYTITLEKRELDLKSLLMIVIENFKDTNNSLKEMQENTGKQLEALKEEQKNPLKNYRKT